MQDIVSTETLLGMMGDLIISVDDELEKLAKEEEENVAKFSFMQDANGHLEHDEEQGDADEEETTKIL